MELRPGIAIDETDLRAFARRHGIRRISLFGSALGDSFGPASDVDLLVEFDPESVPGFLTIAKMEIELSGLLGRQVDLRTYGDLSRYFRDEVRSMAREFYAA